MNGNEQILLTPFELQYTQRRKRLKAMKDGQGFDNTELPGPFNSDTQSSCLQPIQTEFRLSREKYIQQKRKRQRQS